MLRFKLVQCGDTNAGKTSFARRVSGKKFVHEVQPTIGIDVQSLRHTIGTHKIILQYWDTAGQERHFSLTNNFFRGVHLCFIFVDLSSCTEQEWKQRLATVKVWTKRLEDAVQHRECEIRYIGTKRDSSTFLNSLQVQESFPILSKENKSFDPSLYEDNEIVDAKGIYSILQFTDHLVLTSSKNDSQSTFDHLIYSVLISKLQKYQSKPTIEPSIVEIKGVPPPPPSCC